MLILRADCSWLAHLMLIDNDLPIILIHCLLQSVDRIYVLSDGVVAEQGTHAQLMAGEQQGGHCVVQQSTALDVTRCCHACWQCGSTCIPRQLL